MNSWCSTLGIDPPQLEQVATHREANGFALLLVALLERGAPMTLAEVATRFERAGIAERSRALQLLQRCKPARPPVYREGDAYGLDPHDDTLSLWTLRLGLRPPKVRRSEPPAKIEVLLPGPDTPLTQSELDEAWKDASLFSWSAQRLVLAVLDAHGDALLPEEVVAAVAARTRWHGLIADSAKFRRRGSPVRVLDGRWAVADDVALRAARSAVRDRVTLKRRNAAMRPDPAVIEARETEWQRERARHAIELASLSRAIVVAFPPSRPRVATLLDVVEHTIATFTEEAFDDLRARLSGYDVLGGIDIRALLRSLEFDPGDRRLPDLGPPQKTKKLNRRGRTLRITTALLVQGSCGISKPFGDGDKLAEYLASGDLTKLRRRLEADAKSLYALYEYGRIQGAVRLRWGFLDERIPAPWVDRDETRLYDLKKSALALGVPLEIVVGNAPGWESPWSRARLARVQPEPDGWRTWLVGEDGYVVDDADVQRARLSVPLH